MAKYSIPQLRRKQTEIRNITNKLNQAQSACKVTSDQLLNVWTGDGADAFRTYYGKVDANISIMVSGCMALDKIPVFPVSGYRIRQKHIPQKLILQFRIFTKWTKRSMT